MAPSRWLLTRSSASSAAESRPILSIGNWSSFVSSLFSTRSVDFETDMPREPTGKLFKRLLKARYWPEPAPQKEKANAQ